MKLFKFGKDAGERVGDALTDNFFTNIFKRNKLENNDVKAEAKGDRVVLTGKAKTREEAEKIVVAAGNNAGVAEVESHIEVEEEAPEATFYEVKSGDTLSGIAKAHYGDAMKYPKIFEANKPMLSDPDKIYPGQVLRIPPVEA